MKKLLKFFRVERCFRSRIYTVSVFENRTETLRFMMIDCPADATNAGFIFKNVFRTNSSSSPWFHCVLPDDKWAIVGKFTDIHDVIKSGLLNEAEAMKLYEQAYAFTEREGRDKNWFLLRAPVPEDNPKIEPNEVD